MLHFRRSPIFIAKRQYRVGGERAQPIQAPSVSQDCAAAEQDAFATSLPTETPCFQSARLTIDVQKELPESTRQLMTWEFEDYSQQFFSPPTPPPPSPNSPSPPPPIYPRPQKNKSARVPKKTHK